MTETLEYELIEISFSFGYDLEREGPVSMCLHDDSTIIGNEPKPSIQYDADGIPMGQSMEEIRMRQEIILAFFRDFQKGAEDRKVYNAILEDDILIRSISVTEAKEHSSKSYRSTKAVLLLEEVLAKAKPVRRMPVKVGSQNQKPFAYMLVLTYECESLGIVKLTVGVRQKNERDKPARIQYGVSALPEGQNIYDNLKESDKSQKKKRKAHR